MREPAAGPPRPAPVAAPEAPAPLEVLVDGLAEEPRALALVAEGARHGLLADLGGRWLVRHPRGWSRTVDAPLPDGSLRFASSQGALVVGVAASSEALVFVAVAEDANEAPQVTRVPLRGALVSLRRAERPRELVVAASTARGEVLLVRYDVAARADARVLESAESAEDGLTREVLALALDGDDGPFAALHRRGVPEDPRGAVLLTTERGTFELEPLHELAIVDAFSRRGDRVALVSSFEFDRPIAFEFDVRGRLVRFDRTSHASGSAGADGVGAPGRASVDGDARQVTVRVRTAAGDLVTERHVARAGGATPAAITRAGAQYVVAFSERSPNAWRVSAFVVAAGGAVEEP